MSGGAFDVAEIKELSMLGISPSPWKIGDCHVKDAENISCASCVTKPEAPRNRLLIAVAPEMYECLRQAYMEKIGEYEFKGNEVAHWGDVLKKANGFGVDPFA